MDCVLICGGFVVVLSILRILGSLTKESGLLLKTKECMVFTPPFNPLTKVGYLYYNQV